MNRSTIPTVARTVEPPPTTLLLRRLGSFVAGATLIGVSTAVALAAFGGLPAGPGSAVAGLGPDTMLGSAAFDPAASADPSGSVDPDAGPPAGAVTAPVEPAPGTGSAEAAPAPIAPDPGSSVAPGDVVPPRTSRLVAVPPRRLLDTRGDGTGATTAAAPLPGVAQVVTVDAGPSAVLLSVTVGGTAEAGSVTADGRAGIVEAISVPGPGRTTTALAVVPVVGDQVAVASSAGGHLIVDLVGVLDPVDGPVAAGRLIPTGPQPVGRLVTATDGRRLTVDVGTAVPLAQADAVLLELEADVGSDGGTIGSGPTADDLTPSLMWGPGSGAEDRRRGLVLVRPDETGRVTLEYHGGSVLTATVVAWVTGEGAEVDTAGLIPLGGSGLGPAGASGGTLDSPLGPVLP